MDVDRPLLYPTYNSSRVAYYIHIVHVVDGLNRPWVGITTDIIGKLCFSDLIWYLRFKSHDMPTLGL